MRKLTNLIIVILAAGLLYSCATTYRIGRQYQTEPVAKIIIGRTSEKDIVGSFGDPYQIGVSNGDVVYTYYYQEIIFYNDDTIEKRGNILVIEFDKDKMVKNYYFNIPGKDSDILGLLINRERLLKIHEAQVASQTTVIAVQNE
jgi:outer membrane protein assembly factor BamE (lipoprotein component of BamABCDE complex)